MSVKLTIKYNNGNKDVFEFSPAAITGAVGTQLKEFFNSPSVILQLEEGFEIIPMTSIQSISVTPARDEIKELKIPGVLIAKRIS